MIILTLLANHVNLNRDWSINMPKDKTETYQKIIPCAKREFLAKGFEKASRAILHSQ
jgi:hypothetical protein